MFNYLYSMHLWGDLRPRVVFIAELLVVRPNVVVPGELCVNGVPLNPIARLGEVRNNFLGEYLLAPGSNWIELFSWISDYRLWSYGFCRISWILQFCLY